MGGGYDMKAVQKEAVLSYYKAKASSSTAATPSTATATPSTNGDSSTNGDIRRSVSPRPHPHQVCPLQLSIELKRIAISKFRGVFDTETFLEQTYVNFNSSPQVRPG